jgi:hypothetical protein
VAKRDPTRLATIPPARRAAGLLWELSKFGLTGVLTFACSAAWTWWVMEPIRNVSLTPVALYPRPLCVVDTDALRKTLAVPTDEADLPNRTYRALLGDLQRSIELAKVSGRSTPTVQDLSSPSVPLAKLHEDGIVGINCSPSQGDAPMGVLDLEVVLTMARPDPSAFSRQCELVLETTGRSPVSIPLRVVDELEGRNANERDDDAGTIVVNQFPKRLRLRYDPSIPSFAGEVAPARFSALSKQIKDNERFKLSLSCSVVLDSGRQDVGRGKCFTFRGTRLEQVSNGACTA